MTSGGLLLLLGPGCAWMAGLEVLDEVPAAFPLVLEGETGAITSPRRGDQVSVDLVRSTPAEARAAWRDLQVQAEARGFSVVEERVVERREEVVLDGSDGRLVLACCPRRADGERLVLVSWFP